MSSRAATAVSGMQDTMTAQVQNCIALQAQFCVTDNVSRVSFEESLDQRVALTWHAIQAGGSPEVVASGLRHLKANSEVARDLAMSVAAFLERRPMKAEVREEDATLPGLGLARHLERIRREKERVTKEEDRRRTRVASLIRLQPRSGPIRIPRIRRTGSC